jgi:hypothetical protein
MHTLLDLHGNIPTLIAITSGTVHDVNILDQILPEPGAFYVVDRGNIDFERLYVFTLSAAFVVRTKENILLERRYSHPFARSTGVRSDQTVILIARNRKPVPRHCNCAAAGTAARTRMIAGRSGAGGTSSIDRATVCKLCQ